MWWWKESLYYHCANYLYYLENDTRVWHPIRVSICVLDNSKIYDKKQTKKTYGAPGPTLNPFDFGFCPSLALAPLIVGLV